MTIKRVCLYSRTYFIEWLQMFLPTFYLEEAIKQDSKHGLYTTVNHFSILRLETGSILRLETDRQCQWRLFRVSFSRRRK